VLLEVGLGGRLDATNVIAAPLAAVITAVSLDHEKFLGETITAIAHEKAGILKRGRPGIVATQGQEALAEIEREGQRARADLFIANRDWIARPEGGRLVYEDDDGLVDLPAPRLLGRHQYANAGTAIAALRRAGLKLPVVAFETGLATVEWPARLQSLAGGALFTGLPDAEIWLDGGHNPAAGHVIAEAMADLEERAPKPLILITGMLNTKDPIGFFKPFAGLALHVYTVPVPGSPASRDPAELAHAAEAAGLTAEAKADVPAALRAVAGGRTTSPPRVLICGSLYLAGTVLAMNGTPPR